MGDVCRDSLEDDLVVAMGVEFLHDVVVRVGARRYPALDLAVCSPLECGQRLREEMFAFRAAVADSVECEMVGVGDEKHELGGTCRGTFAYRFDKGRCGGCLVRDDQDSRDERSVVAGN